MTAANPLKIYISSTFSDLEEFRDAVRRQIERLGWNVRIVSMEGYIPEGQRNLEKCLRDVRDCDIYLGIIGHRYGSIPDEEVKASPTPPSYTECEYREAVNHAKTRLMFVAAHSGWDLENTDYCHEGGGAKIKALRAEIKRDNDTHEFKTPADLASAVSAALLKQLRPQLEEVAKSAKDERLPGALLDTDEKAEQLARCYVPLRCTTHRPNSIASTPYPTALLPKGGRRFYEQQPASLEQVEFDDVEQALDLHPRFVLLGEAGSGKTTTLENLQLKLLSKPKQNGAGRTPLLVRLGNWPEDVGSFGNLLLRQRQEDALDHVPINRMLLLIDGLNLLPSDRYESVVAAIDKYFKDHDEVRAVITSQKRHYSEHKQLSLPVVELHPLDEPRIKCFVDNYLGPDIGAMLWDALTDGVVERQRLIHLAKNPFDLSAFCSVYARGRGVPRSRAALFQEDAHWRLAAQLPESSSDDIDSLEACFGKLAIAMFQSRRMISSDLSWAEQLMPRSHPAENPLKLGVKCGLLRLKQNGRQLEFMHTLVQSYFAAKYLSHHPAEWDSFFKVSSSLKGQRSQYVAEIEQAVYLLSELIDSQQQKLNSQDLCRRLAGFDPVMAVGIAERACNRDASLSVATMLTGAPLRQLLHELESSTEGRRALVADKLVSVGNVVLPEIRKTADKDNKTCKDLATIVSQVVSLDVLDWMVDLLGHRYKHARKVAEVYIEALLFQHTPLLRRYISERLPEKANKAENAKALLKILADAESAADVEEQEGPDVNALRRVIADVAGPDALADWAESQRFQGLERVKLGQARAVDSPALLIPQLRNMNPTTAHLLIHQLAQLGSSALPECLKALESEGPTVKRRVCRALGLMKDVKAFSALARLCTDSNRAVRLDAVRALGLLGDPMAVPFLEPMLAAPESEVRIHAVRALGHMDEPSAKALLRARLEDRQENIEVRFHALVALDGLGDSTAMDHADFEALRTYGRDLAVNKNSAIAAVHAFEALEVLQDPTVAQLAEDYLYSSEVILRRTGLQYWHNVGRLICTPETQLTPEQRGAQIRRLVAANETDMVKRVAFFLYDHDYRVRLEAICALAESGRSEALDYLTRLAERDRKPEIRAVAGRVVDRLHKQKPASIVNAPRVDSKPQISSR